MNMPPASTPTSGYSNSGSGNGATHTVIVAPTQGVLRYVPFVVNASVGDTVLFMWGANNHTVTKSSQLELCNKTSDAPFASGEQNKSFMFSQVVNDTSPTFYYCGTPTHCEKGMFGIINPPNAYQQPSSLAAMMPMLTSQNPSTNASWAYTSNYTANNSAVANWAMSLDMSQMPTWAAPYVAENVMYSQNFLNANPGTLSPNGTVDLSGLSNGTMTVPADIAAAARQNNAGSSTPSYSSPAASGASPSPSATGSPSGALKNGAGALASPRIVVALVAVAAAAFAL
jgi:plastocyanin